MSCVTVYSAQPHHLSGKIVEVSVDITRSTPYLGIIGMASKAVDEARERVRSAIKNSGYKPIYHRNEKVTVALGPAELRKYGGYHDVAIALGYLLAIREINFATQGKIFIGELSLNGSIRKVSGILTLVRAAQQLGYRDVYVPQANANEARLVQGIRIHPSSHINELILFLEKGISQPYREVNKQKNDRTVEPEHEPEHSFHLVRGQEAAKRGLIIAATGGHNIMLYGPPGTGKTLLAKSFCELLPRLDHEQSLEVTSIYSIAGLLKDSVILHPSFRKPHHTASYAAMVGGGAIINPGEITLAHHGVLFMDEFPEFNGRVLEALRQPLEERTLTLSRAHSKVTLPSACILIGAMNPCPCGFYESTIKPCTCKPHQINRYQKKISGPLANRIDLWIPVNHIDYDVLMTKDKRPTTKGKSSSEIDKVRSQIITAREIQRKRQQKQTRYLNAEISTQDFERMKLRSDVNDLLRKSSDTFHLAPRAIHRLIKIARSIADLDTSHDIQEKHLLEALRYRQPQWI